MRRILMGTASCNDLPVQYYVLADAREDGTEG